MVRPLVCKLLEDRHHISSAPDTLPSIHRCPLNNVWENASSKKACVKYQRNLKTMRVMKIQKEKKRKRSLEPGVDETYFLN